ncbi:MAG: hypothetical protein HWN67_12280 [Candidatus Helarchaeota archaeon]|nr:hypothetical protein [Candidatus Helarchaeota archaeon]
MRIDLEDIGVSLDIGDWVHKYVEEIQTWAARKKPEQPFPNLKIDVKDEKLYDLHDVSDILIDQIKESLPPEAKFSNIQKFNIGDNKALSVDISGRKLENKDILIIMKIIATSSNIVILSFTLEADTLPKYKDEFQQITQSFKKI